MKTISMPRTHRVATWLHLPVALLAATTSSSITRAAEFIPLGFLPNRGSEVIPSDVSDDGTVVAGHVRRSNDSDPEPATEAFRWTEETGMVGLGFLPHLEVSQISEQGGPKISGDGSTIIGHTGRAEPGGPAPSFVHTAIDGIQEFNLGRADGVSYDGNVIVGNLNGEAYRWTDETGLVPLGFLPGDSDSRAHSVSADGRTIVGRSGEELYRWTPATGMIGLGVTAGLPLVSDDGSTIASASSADWHIPIPGVENGEGYRWTEETGAVSLGSPNGVDNFTSSHVDGINGDGSLVVGWLFDQEAFDAGEYGFSAFVWSERFGMEILQDALIARHGLGDELESWTLGAALDISADGRFIVGAGTSGLSDREGFLIRLDRPFGAVPEPSTVVLLAAGAIALCWRRRNSAQFPQGK